MLFPLLLKGLLLKVLFKLVIYKEEFKAKNAFIE